MSLLQTKIVDMTVEDASGIILAVAIGYAIQMIIFIVGLKVLDKWRNK